MKKNFQISLKRVIGLLLLGQTLFSSDLPIDSGADQFTFLVPLAESVNSRFLRRLYEPLRSLTISDPCQNKPHHLNVWLESSYEKGGIQNTGREKGFHAEGYEISIGSHTSPNPFWTAGVSFSYEHDHLNFHAGGSGENDSFIGALYSLFRPMDSYVLTNFLFGYSWQKVKRDVNGNMALHSHPTLYQGIYYLEGGKDFSFGHFLIQPFLGLELGFYRLNRFKDQGDISHLHITLHEKSHGSAVTRWGAHITLRPQEDFFISLDAAWNYRLTSYESASHTHIHFHHKDEEETVLGPYVHRSSFDGALEFSYEAGEHLEVFTEVASQIWKRAYNVSILGGIKCLW